MTCLNDDLVFRDVHVVVAGVELCKAGNVPDDGEEDDRDNVDGAGEAAKPMPRASKEDHLKPEAKTESIYTMTP